MFPFDPIVCIEFSCLIAAIVFLYKDKTLFWRLALYYQILVFAVEFTGSYMGNKGIHNLWLYNIFIFFEVGFIFYGIRRCLKIYNKEKKPVILGMVITYITYFSSFILRGFLVYNSITISVMSVIFVVLALYYYYLLLKDENFIDIRTNPEFWWITGVLFYYFGSTISNIFYDVLTINIFGRITITYVIFVILCFILYGLWTYSYICRAKQRKLQS